MDAEWEIVAVFEEIGHAVQAQNLLRHNQIRSEIVENQPITVDWLTDNPGNIGIHVNPIDADLAADLISEHLGDQSIICTSTLSSEELEKQALAEPSDEEYHDDSGSK